MTWWAWVLVWVVLVALAAVVLWFAARRLLRQGAALARELGEAADLMSEVSRRLEQADPAGAPVPSAVPTATVRRPSTRGSRRRLRRGAGSQDVRWR